MKADDGGPREVFDGHPFVEFRPEAVPADLVGKASVGIVPTIVCSARDDAFENPLVTWGVGQSGYRGRGCIGGLHWKR